MPLTIGNTSRLPWIPQVQDTDRSTDRDQIVEAIRGASHGLRRHDVAVDQMIVGDGILAERSTGRVADVRSPRRRRTDLAPAPRSRRSFGITPIARLGLTAA